MRIRVKIVKIKEKNTLLSDIKYAKKPVCVLMPVDYSSVDFVF